MTKIAGSGSINQRHGSADPDPDPHYMSWIRNTAIRNRLADWPAALNLRCDGCGRDLGVPITPETDLFELVNMHSTECYAAVDVELGKLNRALPAAVQPSISSESSPFCGLCNKRFRLNVELVRHNKKFHRSVSEDGAREYQSGQNTAYQAGAGSDGTSRISPAGWTQAVEVAQSPGTGYFAQSSTSPRRSANPGGESLQANQPSLQKLIDQNGGKRNGTDICTYFGGSGSTSLWWVRIQT